ncbi:probable LRR receptor-like serine/threonine-protein kinase At5g48740 [Cryptomeria japonica]|uniref:probable LRR receptor-like serine/threonine-protein kinase At5g48740 n=1 Tax=Cryptomeria japonica TaxID=3369 RepID=UPI0027DA20DF|nr:probable LRR receptor-like serine/threonine-protein kinase At5g48740 [Cryptomeria japonica]
MYILVCRYTRNPHLCKGKDKCHSNKSNKAGIVVKSTIGVAVPAFVAVILLIIYLRRHNSNKRNKMVNMNANHAVTVLNPVKSRSFSLVEMMRATQDLSQKIGEGGFGSVYFGKLQDGKDVAVKLLSSTSKQGATEFLNEIDLLSRLNHRNLVSLLGYCNDFKQLMLVYEHMPCGSLKYHLYGSLSKSSTLDWKIRLRVALDAAEGSISPMDVKSSNILLNSRLWAKVADFGLSKMIGDDNASHVTTTIKGSVGYLDPEYFRTSKLTDKSDVYSFGVVLLEIICGRKPIDAERSEEELSLIKWVMLHIEMNEESGSQLTDILDKRLRLSENDFKSFYDLLALSIKCIQNEAFKRPTISEIVTHIRGDLISVESNDTTQEYLQSFSFAEYSCSLVQTGR